MPVLDWQLQARGARSSACGPPAGSRGRQVSGDLHFVAAGVALVVDPGHRQLVTLGAAVELEGEVGVLQVFLRLLQNK